ncbi:hypothetical protein BC830DRAFT_1085267 [Chytriomyces sp. MP71]|nr:hypothetical protein BC830DRAFT_1085267 [Chytriomyces sp. MP71]
MSVRLVNSAAGDDLDTVTEVGYSVVLVEPEASYNGVFPVLQYDKAINLKDAYTQVTVVKSRVMGKWLRRLREYQPEGRHSCEYEYISELEPSSDEVLELLEGVHSDVGTINHIARHLPNHYGRYALIHGPSFVYRYKADGDHVWLVDAGSYWYMCRNNCALEEVGYVPKWKILQCPVLPSIVRFSGVIQPISGSIQSSLGALLSLPDLPDSLVTRKDYTNIDDLKRDLSTSIVPCDSIIVIDKHSSQTYCIKEPTVDLIIEALPGMTELLVYESTLACHLTELNCISVAVQSYHLRYDQDLPNMKAVYDTIVASAVDKGSAVPRIDRELKYFFFCVRQYIYDIALQSRHTGCLIIDAGSGNLQSHSFIADLPNTKWLLIDPELHKPAKVDSRGWINATSYNDSSVISLLSNL